jgi:phosphohistidine swiveling domain-containing protein
MLSSNTDKKNFIKWVTRPGSVTRDEPLLSWQVNEGVHMTFSVPTGDGNLEYYLDKVEYEQLINKTVEEISTNTLNHLSQYEHSRKRMVEAAQKVKRLVNGDTQELLVAYKEYFKATQDFCIYLVAPYALKDVIEPQLSNTLSADFEKVTALGKPTVFHHFQKALLEKKPEDLEKEFAWINVYSIKNKPYTLEQIIEIQNKTDKAEVAKALKEIEENERRFNEFLKTINDEKLRSLCLLSHEYAFLRTDRIDAWKEAMSALTPFVEHLAQIIGEGCTIEDAGELFYHEIVNLLQNGTKPKTTELKARSAHKGIFVYTPENRGSFVQDQAEKERLLSLIFLENYGKELKGTVACKGRAAGPVRVVLTDADFKEFNKGDVLVATWTEPKYTSIMRLASAIVTDEGGLTSHAAIVSRELNIPCVIGTKNATKVLKNGDMVEVDAERGVVSIVKTTAEK